MKNTSIINHWTLRAAGLFASSAIAAHAAQQVSFDYSLPVQVSAQIASADCQNSKGPQVTLSGELKLGGLQLRLIFRNNERGTHTAVSEWETDLTLIPAGSSIRIPKQPVLGGVGGNPHIFLQFTDASGNDLSDEVYLGRCVQGLKVATDLGLVATVLTLVSAADCSNNPGPFITFDGEIALAGLHAKFIFRNNANGRHAAEASREVALITDGWTITIPKQPVLGGVGGNPRISVQVLDGNGNGVGKEIYLGRCTQL